jgi:hypothetical protein
LSIAASKDAHSHRTAEAEIEIGSVFRHQLLLAARRTQLAFMELALAAAIEAQIPRERILNFMPLERLRAWTER